MSAVPEPMTHTARRSTWPQAITLSTVYASTILASAFLLFQVQPLISKLILPWFGGSPAVWTTCMLFFQTLLFGGYAYAHVSENVLRPRTRRWLHLGLLAAAVALLPIVPGENWKPADSEQPVWRILSLLMVSVGLPYFVLSSTGPLVQSWFSRTYPGRSPYRLYSLSNLGSLAALLSYPFVFEPRFDVGTQAGLWSWGFVVFALLSAGGLWGLQRTSVEPIAAAARVTTALDRSPTIKRRLLWIGLPAFASLMLLATTNHVCQDVAVMPFLWVVPLSLYLLTFIVCFDHDRWYHRAAWAAGTAVLILAVAGMSVLPFNVGFVAELVLCFGAMFGVCMLCHGELARLKPAPRFLTQYYLMMSAGGALGGLCVSLLAPALFDSFFEWKIGLFGGYVIAAALLLADLRPVWRLQGLGRSVPTTMASVAGLMAMPYLQAGSGREPLAETRNFYGEAAVIERAADDPDEHDRALLSGGIVHGVQFVAPEKRNWTTTYYSEQSGVGRVLSHFSEKPRLRVGAVGLGVGTLAAYAQPGHEYRFYEINPEMLRFAETYFSFLKDCRGETEIVLGDARLSMEREPPQHYDVLVLDAFSGDAVPAHLLTDEAFALYDHHLADGGVLCVHVTNTYLDLAPVVRGAATEHGFHVARVSSDSNRDRALYRADWLLLSRDPEILNAVAGDQAEDSRGRTILWTDGYSNLFQILRD